MSKTKLEFNDIDRDLLGRRVTIVEFDADNTTAELTGKLIRLTQTDEISTLIMDAGGRVRAEYQESEKELTVGSGRTVTINFGSNDVEVYKLD